MGDGLWWLWWWLGALCDVKTNEVLGLWICVWVVGFVWTCFGSVNVWFVKCEASHVWACDHVWFFVEFNSCVRQAVCGLVIRVVDRCFCMQVDEIYEQITILYCPCCRVCSFDSFPIFVCGCVFPERTKQLRIMLDMVKWKFKVSKNGNSDYSLCFRCCGFVVAVCSLLTMVVYLCSWKKKKQKMKENNVKLIKANHQNQNQRNDPFYP